VPTADLGPLETAEQREQVSLAALLLLERLTPQERAVCVLRDGFEYPYRDLGQVLGLTESYCRQLHRRARARLAEDAPPRFDVPASAHVELGGRLFAAALDGDLAGLEALLADDALLVSDGGGLASAARRPIRSRSKVARFVLGITGKLDAATLSASLEDLNGQPAMVVREGGRITTVVFLESDGDRVLRLLFVVNPDKLARVAAVTSEEPASSQG
jgi:RNA polymerase sigma-70 factor (ECF subfamily)